MRNKKLYQILMLSEQVDAVAIRRAYRELAVKYHSDTNGSCREAERRFNEIAKAYAILSDKEKRAQYDQGLIDDNGHATYLASSSFLRIRETVSSRAYQQYFPQDLPFFRPCSAFYLFFNSYEEASAYRPLQSVNAPVYVYVTSTPLGLLCSKIHKATNEKPIFHQKNQSHPTHVVVKATHAPYMEKHLDDLIKERVLLKLLVDVQDVFNSRSVLMQ